MPVMVSRTMDGISTYPEVVTSPATWTSPVVVSDSTATRELGSTVRSASRMASETWSQILSGWPMVTDSELNRRIALEVTGSEYPRAGRIGWLHDDF